jgi:hypothetical protein
VRLTLRTLLAYLDDTLDPTQAKLIGQKVAESDTAQELIARIKQVTRRRRLTNPPATGPGAKVDANAIAEYLDNALDSEQLAEVEQVCLASDVHLAEIAACHQILTLVLGEPALVPPTSRQRMYSLVKGPEAIPFRKPPAGASDALEDIDSPGKEADETLRLGLPAFRRKGSWQSRLVLVGGALALAAILAVAIWQVLRVTGGGDADRSGPVALREQERESEKKAPTELEKKGKAATPEKSEKTKAKTEPESKEEKKAPKKETSTEPGPTEKTEKGEKPAPPEVGLAPPRTERVVAGTYRPAPEQPSVLLQRRSGKGAGPWQRLLRNKNDEVYTAEPLLSLPGYRSEVRLKTGVRLVLWGHVPELYPTPPTLETLATLHPSDTLDLDLTLHRGRIIVGNLKDKGPANVRIRFDNPTNPEHKEAWDITLGEKTSDKTAEVLVQRWNFFPPEVPFFKDAKNPERLGPTAQVALIVLQGNIDLKADSSTESLQAPPGSAVMTWSSTKGLAPRPFHLDKLPEEVKANPPLPPNFPPALRPDMLKALDQLSKYLSGKSIEVGLSQARASDNPNLRVLAVRCYGALDDLDRLVEEMSNKEHQDVRMAAIQEVRYWTSCQRDNDLKVYEQLRKRYTDTEADIIMPMLQSLHPSELARPETYEALIDYLTNTNSIIRELAYGHLYYLVPAGRQIRYMVMDDPANQQMAQEAYRKLIPRGKLPPPPPKTPGP